MLQNAVEPTTSEVLYGTIPSEAGSPVFESLWKFEGNDLPFLRPWKPVKNE